MAIYVYVCFHWLANITSEKSLLFVKQKEKPKDFHFTNANAYNWEDVAW